MIRPTAGQVSVHTHLSNPNHSGKFPLATPLSNAFPKSDRLVRGPDITRVLKRGACVADGVLVLFAVRRDDASSTVIGITIPKKTGNAAERNRWKRLIRESFRTQREAIPVGLELVIRPKKDAAADWSAIQRSVPSLARRVVKRLNS